VLSGGFLQHAFEGGVVIGLLKQVQASDGPIEAMIDKTPGSGRADVLFTDRSRHWPALIIERFKRPRWGGELLANAWNDTRLSDGGHISWNHFGMT